MSRTLSISSKNSIVSDPVARNRIRVQLFEPIRVPNGYDAFLSVSDAQIPNSLYNVTGPFVFNAFYNGVAYQPSTPRIATIPNGNYTLAQLAAALNGVQLRPYYNVFGAPIVSLTATIQSGNIVLGQTQATNSPVTYPNFSPNTGLVVNCTSSVLGFQNQFINYGTPTVGLLTPCLAPKYYIVTSSLLQISQAEDVIKACSQGPSHIVPLAKIPATVPFGWMELYLKKITFEQMIPDTFIQTFDLAILDDQGGELSFNGSDWSLNLVLSIRKSERKKFTYINEWIWDKQPNFDNGGIYVL